MKRPVRTLSLIFCLFFPAPVAWAGAPLQGLPLVNLNLQFSAPLKVVPGATAGTWEPSVYGLPISIGATVGYILEWTPSHRTMAIYTLNYDDDPVNNLFDGSLQTKTATPSFNGQTLYQMLSFKHNMQLLPILKLGGGVESAISLTRNSPAETFDKGLYNTTEIGLVAEASLQKIPSKVELLRSLRVNGRLNIKGAIYPNYSDSAGRGDGLLSSLSGTTTTTVRTNREDLVRYILGFDAYTTVVPNLDVNLSYELNLDPYGQKWLLDRSGNQTDKPETVSRNLLQAGASWTLRNPIGKPLLALGARFQLDNRDSDWLEQSVVASNMVGDLPSSVAGSALPVSGGNTGLFFPRFKAETSVAFGPTLAFFFSPTVAADLGYTATRKEYGGKYARFGAADAGRIAGSYKSEKVWQTWDTVSVTFRFRDDTGYRVFQPYFGYQMKESNDRGDGDGRYQVFFVGFKSSYEF